MVFHRGNYGHDPYNDPEPDAEQHDHMPVYLSLTATSRSEHCPWYAMRPAARHDSVLPPLTYAPLLPLNSIKARRADTMVRWMRCAAAETDTAPRTRQKLIVANARRACNPTSCSLGPFHLAHEPSGTVVTLPPRFRL